MTVAWHIYSRCEKGRPHVMSSMQAGIETQKGILSVWYLPLLLSFTDSAAGVRSFAVYNNALAVLPLGNHKT